jgi:hypothetical protein
MCEKDHGFCEDCASKIYNHETSHEERVAFVESHNWFEPGDDRTNKDLVRGHYEELVDERNLPSTSCPCCKRRVIPRSDLLPFLLKKYSLTEEQVKEMIRNES